MSACAQRDGAGIVSSAAETTASFDAKFAQDVLAGLARPQKSLSCRWLYDDIGSQLFEDITQLPEYYPTRTEVGILGAAAGSIADFAGPKATVLEYGAGAAIKTELLLDALTEPRAYVPIDIAAEFLASSVSRLRRRFGDIEIYPVPGDFMAPLILPDPIPERQRVIFFPGSTLGNLSETEARELLKGMHRHVGGGGKAIIGIDLVKDVRELLAAYDDTQGVTARFNLNLLVRINRELAGDFAVGNFRHAARWNEAECAVEMHLVSQTPQIAQICGQTFCFAAGETIHTESSRKYSLERIAALANQSSWDVREIWTDPARRFAVVGLTAQTGGGIG